MAIRVKTKYIVVHCTATPADFDIGVEWVRKVHKAKGWRDVGYHYVIKRDGTVESGRPQQETGAHVKYFNSVSVGVALVGGVDNNHKAENNFTKEQFSSLLKLVKKLKGEYTGAKILGHRDLSPDKNKDGKITQDEWLKECPSFDVNKWLQEEDK